MMEVTTARIPVRPLPYLDKDIAMTRELVIDYDKGNIYITDKDDPKILIDITKLIAESYLSNINGDNTTVTINGEIYNLSKLLADLNKNKILILNSAEPTSVPVNVKYDNTSVSIKNNLIGIYGFDTAVEESKPVKRNGSIVWVDPQGSGDPSQPTPGSNINVITIMPTNDSIILYNKAYMYTDINTTSITSYLVHLPFSNPMYSKIKWKIDTKVALSLSFPSNILWINDSIVGTSVIKSITANNSYMIELETWDFGVSWICTQSIMFPIVINEGMLPGRNTYLIDNSGALLTDGNGAYLVTGGDPTARGSDVVYANNAVVIKEESVAPRMTRSADGTGVFYLKNINEFLPSDNQPPV